ncbi:hypothetical protein EV702DRAFT_1047719 [Suillus placidus]|uniref:Uncharacterized protein n=1 Tax=Suillus placidus TaxID=48579 RepID=A0A9P6ZPH9_9AGAM|nr:hypothetical protein EV702DRAFT_1047719 [Suillus placidus]
MRRASEMARTFKKLLDLLISITLLDQDKLKIRKAVTQWFNNHSCPANTNDHSLESADAAAATAGWISVEGTLANKSSTVQSEWFDNYSHPTNTNDHSLEGTATAAATAGQISAEGSLVDEGSAVQSERFNNPSCHTNMNDWEDATAVAATASGSSVRGSLVDEGSVMHSSSATSRTSAKGTLANGSASGDNIYTITLWDGEKV